MKKLVNAKNRKDTTVNYRLSERILAEHEHNIGPLPSGYAYLRIRLEPLSENDEIVIISPPDSVWAVRSTKESKNIDPDKMERLIDLYKIMIMKGISEGVRKGLSDSLDYPLTNVRVSIEEVKFDIMYSTEASFYYVSLNLVERMLIEAHDKVYVSKNN